MPAMKTIVAIGAHHDDIELRCGGTLASYIKQGWRAVYVVATTTPYYASWPNKKTAASHPSNSEVIEMRKDEARKGAAALGIASDAVHFFDFKSLYWYEPGTKQFRYFTGLPSDEEQMHYVHNDLPGRELIVTAMHCQDSIDFLSEFLRQQQADIVLTHFPDDGHWEHYAVANFVCKSVRQLASDGEQLQLFAWQQGGEGNLTPSFAPTHFVDVSDGIEEKCAALRCFPSQFGDHNPEPFATSARSLAQSYGDLVGMGYAEAFMSFHIERLPYNDMYLPATYDANKAQKGFSTKADVALID